MCTKIYEMHDGCQTNMSEKVQEINKISVVFRGYLQLP